MSHRRFRWTRERYREADHLCRLLSRMGETYSPPELVERFLRLWNEHQMNSRRDPLDDPLWLRLSRHKGDDIPF